MTIVTSKLILQLQDELSDNARKVVTSLDKVKSAEAALASQSGKLNEASGRLVQFSRLDARLAATTTKLAEQRAEMKDLGAAILATEGPTKSMEARYRALEKSVGVLNRKIGEQRGAVESARTEFEKLNGSLDSVASAEARIRVGIDETTAAIRRQMAVSTEARKVEQRNVERREALKRSFDTAGMMAGPAILQGTRESVRSGATVQSERVRIAQLGNAVTADQGKEMETRALDLATKYKTVTQAEFMHMMRNAVTTVGGVDEAMSIIDPLGKLRVIADAQHPGQSSGEEFDQLIKGMEIGGVTRDPAKFESYMNGIAKGLNAFGDTLKPYQYYEMFKYGRGATPRLSEDFMLSIGPSLGQELGGSSFGKAVSAFEQTVVTGRMKKQAGQTFASLGLVDPKDLQEGKGGEVSVRKGASIRGWQIAQSDPFAWVKDVLLPHLEAAGIKDPEGQSRAVAQMFGDATAQQLVSVMTTQTARIEKDRTIVQGAHGLDSYQDYLSNDPFVALKGLGTSLTTFTGVLTSPGMAGAAKALDGLSSVIGRLSAAYGEFAKQNPKTTEILGDAAVAGALAVGGKMSYNLGAGILKTLTGGGATAALAGSATALDTSALALDKSALALDAAAVKLGSAGAVNTVEKASSEVVKDGKWGLPLLAGAGVPALGAGIILGAGAAAGATNSPMVDDYGRVIGNWGGKDETGNPAYVLPPDAAHAPPIAPYSKDDLDRRLQAQKDVRDQALQGQPGAFHPDDLRERTEPPPAKSFWHQIFGATSTGIVPVSFTKDSSSSSMFEEAVARGTYDGFMRVLEAREGDSGGGGGGGGGIVNASYETPGTGDDVGGNTVRRPENLRYNRQHKAILTHRKGADGGGDGDAGAFSARQPGAAGTYRPVYNLSDADLDQRVVNTIAGEVSTKNPEGVDAVVNNMLNRVGSKGWGPSRNLLEVARAKGQYAGYRQASAAETERIRSRIRAIASGGVPDNTHGSNAYRAAYYHGPWYQKHAASSVVIGGNRFAYEGGVRNGPFAPYDKPKGGATYADESRHGMARSAEHPLLPRRPAPVAPHTDDIQAMNVAPAIDHSSIREALHHVRELKREMASLGSASIDVKHRGFGSRGAHSPGAVRTALNGNFTSDGRWS